MSDVDSLLFVNGTLMSGLELHGNLAGATFVETTRTSPTYRLYSVRDRHPGMFRTDTGGVSVAGELYEVPAAVLKRVVDGEPPGLYVDRVELDDGRWVPGVLFRQELLDGECTDISDYGGWRRYVEGQSRPNS
jgi:adenine/guanine/hypoxanthine permease